MAPQIVARFSEITLKGRNRAFFEKKMVENTAAHLKPYGPWRIKRQHARLVVDSAEDGTADSARKGSVAVEILRGLPGIANVSVVEEVAREPEVLDQAAVDLVAQALENPAAGMAPPTTFAVVVERKDKRYPLSSMEMEARLGTVILEHFPTLKVNLSAPQLSVRVEIWEDRALIFKEKIPGPGGLAVGSSGKALCLISGGIDSPVAAHLMMTRGCPVVHLYFHSSPFIGERSKEKVHDLVRFLARHQPRSRLYVAPFAEIQEAIRDRCPEGMRTVLYRRMMNRVANQVAGREGALALVTGESVGQVASQTMENILAIQETAALPVMQPLIGMSKPEIIRRAQEIGTYTISIQPYPDCCTLFQPRHPETRAQLPKLHRAEQALPMEELVASCLAGLEMTDYGPEYYPARW